VITTVLRSGVHEARDGVRLLRADPDIPYRDGAEERLWEIVKAASDVSSDSTEMLEVARGWAEQYHTHPARANVLRALDIPPDAAVLEVGAGCGPITRYLGETGAQVDALEPVLPRARVARERTRDLANVEVFCGNFEDVPSDPVYDLVIVVGVLEYVGGGGADPEPYLRFLQECRTRLRPGGTLVLAIENKLGVKYLTGTGEDHSGRIFHSVEDYPRLGPARTFSATALLELTRTSGFAPRLFGVFPDYKHTRVVLDTERLYAAAPDLLENLPSFPSRYAGTKRVQLASEERVWKEFVRDGLGSHFPNSFLVIGSTEQPATLWPEARLAKYFSINRRREYVASTTVRLAEGEIRFDRVYSPEPGPLITEGVTSWGYVAGSSFLDAFSAADDTARRDLLRRWLELVRAACDRDTVPLDALPSNVIITTDGELQLIDNEFHDVSPVERVIERGLFWLAVNLGRTTTPETWSPARTIGDLCLQIAGLAQVPLDAPALDRFLEHEAEFQVVVTTNHVGPAAVADASATLRRTRDTPLWHTQLGRRLHHQFDEAIAARDRLQTTLESQEKQIDDLRRSLEDSRTKARRARRALTRLKRSRTYRLADSVRRNVRRVLPRS